MDNILISNHPSVDIMKHFDELSITLPLHQEQVKLWLDPHGERVEIKECLTLHIALSLIEHILKKCSHVSYWLKDHLFPVNNVLFKTEMVNFLFYSRP
jgi:hypothetical protein